MNTYVLGDLHGAHRAFKQVLERSNFNKDSDRLIFLGDVCDGWSEVYECVEELLSIKNLVVIRGNHDEWFNQYITTGTHPAHWTHGGTETLRSYAKHSEREVTVRIKLGGTFTDLTKWDIPDTHVRFFNDALPYFIDNTNVFVHGGFNRHFTIDDQQVSDIFWWDRDLWLQALSANTIADNRYSNLRFKDKWINKVFIGHTPTINWKDTNKKCIDVPMFADKVINVDTGAGFWGKLTLMNVDTLQYFQSDLVKDMYPEELGRN